MYLPNDDNFCGWQTQLKTPPVKQTLSGKKSCRIAVVGAGFTGLSAARRLAHNFPNDTIILIDAQRVGDAASGRNSGFVIDTPHKFALTSANLSQQQALLRLNRFAQNELTNLVTEFAIDCQWSKAGKYQAIATANNGAYLTMYANALTRLKLPYEHYQRDQLTARLGTAFYQQAIFTPDCYLMQPLALVRGLADCLPSNVILYENTPIKQINQVDNGVMLIGEHGKIKAKKVLLATNIFTPELSFLKNRMLPIMTFASITRALNTKEQAHFKGGFDWGVTPADHMATTLRMTQDKRLIIRNTFCYVPKYGLSVSAKIRRGVQDKHRQSLLKRFPQLNQLNFESTWGGSYALSRNFKSFFGRLKTNIYASVCDNGVGVAWGTAAGYLLADEIAGIQSPLLSDIKSVAGLPALNPPKPFLGWGLMARLKLAAWQSRFEL